MLSKKQGAVVPKGLTVPKQWWSCLNGGSWNRLRSTSMESMSRLQPNCRQTHGHQGCIQFAASRLEFKAASDLPPHARCKMSIWNSPSIPAIECRHCHGKQLDLTKLWISEILVPVKKKMTCTTTINIVWAMWQQQKQPSGRYQFTTYNCRLWISSVLEIDSMHLKLLLPFTILENLIFIWLSSNLKLWIGSFIILGAVLKSCYKYLRWFMRQFYWLFRIFIMNQ